MCILLTWPYAFIFAFINIIIYTHSISAKCLDDQMSLLLEFRASLEYNHSASSKLVQWVPDTDCCKWKGVECNDQDGRVIGLDLSNELITSRLDNSSALFRLNSLQNLNLAYNFGSGKIPSAFSKLSKLTYLNLSLCFTGEIPREIAYLVNLVTLDVSTPPNYLFIPLVLPSITFRSIIRNMTHIKELYLDGVNISAGTVEWEALATSLPKLRVLSMSGCFGFTTGTVPSRLFQVSTLEILDLSLNGELEGTLPDFSKNGSLQELVLTYNKFSGILPSSIGNLKRLRKIDVSMCNFHGVIPGTMSSLDKLEYVDLSSNGFSGPIPSFSSAKNLTKLSLASNYLNGSITSTDWKTLLNLSAIDLSNNSFTRRIPISLFSMPSLQELVLGQNKFSGALNRLPNILSSTLKILDLGQNLLEGLIPKSALESRALEKLDLSKNNFKGKLKLGEILGILKNLTDLDLSHNCLSIDANDILSNTSFPKLRTLYLGSCNLRALPRFLRIQPSLTYLDLSDNKIQGIMPNWVWEVGAGNLIILNLSCNNFVGFEHPLPRTKVFTLTTLDLHSNNFQGQLPAISSQLGLSFVDYSDNNFTSIDPEIGYSLSSAAVFFSLSRNNIYGNIPLSLCRATFSLEVLDLGYNHFKGRIPDCVIAMTKTLGILNLRGNNLVSGIPDEFTEKCTLETLDLNGNFLQGGIPRSLANCRKLQVLDLGNNQLRDTFPCKLKSLTKLRVLILKDNQFYGTISCKNTTIIWPPLQILDVSSNHLSGELTSRFLFQWRSMMTGTNQVQSQLKHLQYQVPALGNFYYQDVVTVTEKHSQLMLQEILTTFTSIDLSNNAFYGHLPKNIGNVNALVVLNLSHNCLSGNIPSTLGNLTQLESLDISCNALDGTIPLELTNLNFLEYLNLSFNRLSGEIPKSTQLQSFDASSYEGNLGLHGPPLMKSSEKSKAPEHEEAEALEELDKFQMLKWMLDGAAVGFPVGVTIIVGPLLYIRRWRQWYYYHVDRLLMKIIKN